MTTLPLALLLAVAAAPGERSHAKPNQAGKAVAIVWRGNAKSAAEAARLKKEWDEPGKAIAQVVELPDGYPRVLAPGETYPGLRPGFYPILLGLCPVDDGQLVVKALQKLDPQIYARVVDGPAEPCPSLTGELEEVGPLRVTAHPQKYADPTVSVEATWISLAEDKNAVVAVIRDASGKVLDRAVEPIPCRDVMVGKSAEQESVIVQSVCIEPGQEGMCERIPHIWYFGATQREDKRPVVSVQHHTDEKIGETDCPPEGSESGD